MKEDKYYGYALMMEPMQNTNLQPKEKLDIPINILELLDEYQGIVVNDTPNSLPPIKDIFH